MKKKIISLCLMATMFCSLVACGKSYSNFEDYNYKKVPIIVTNQIDDESNIYSVYKQYLNSDEAELIKESVIIEGDSFYSFKTNEFVYVGEGGEIFKIDEEGNNEKIADNTGIIAYDNIDGSYAYSSAEGVFYNNGKEIKKISEYKVSELYCENGVITFLTLDRQLYQLNKKGDCIQLGINVKEILYTDDLTEKVFFLTFDNQLFIKTFSQEKAVLVDKIVKDGEELFYNVNASESSEVVLYNKSNDDNTYSGLSNLYTKNINSGETQEVVKNVREKGFLIDKKNIYYIKDTGELFINKKSEETKLLDGIKDIYYQGDDIYAIAETGTVYEVNGDKTTMIVESAIKINKSIYGGVYLDNAKNLFVDNEKISEHVSSAVRISNLVMYYTNDGTFVYDIKKGKSYQCTDLSVDGNIIFGNEYL